MSVLTHFGDPCIHCATPHDDVARGPCLGAGSMTFTLDTRGTVYLTNTKWVRSVEWTELDPFTQGYVEALFASADLTRWNERDPAEPLRPVYRNAAFRDLSPEALAAILADCADRQRQQPYFSNLFDQPRDCGARFWRHRNEGGCKNFPPLTPTLADDGKVHLS